MREKILSLFCFFIGLLLLLLTVNYLTLYKDILIVHPAANTTDSHSYAKEFTNLFIGIKQIEDFSFYCIQKSKLQNHSIEVAYVDEKHANFGNLRTLKGRFFISSDMESQKSYVVLDKTLAIHLFATMDCIGKEVTWSSNSYTVIGVVSYKNKIDTFINNTPKLYIPYVNLTSSDLPTIELRSQAGSSDWVKSIVIAFNKDSNVYILNQNRYKILNKLKLLFILLFFLLLSLFYVLTKNAYKKLTTSLIKNATYYYWPQNLAVHKKLITQFILLAIISSFILLSLTQINLYIPPNYLPSTLSYFNKIKEKFWFINNEAKDIIYYSTSKLLAVTYINSLINIGIVLTLSGLSCLLFFFRNSIKSLLCIDTK